MKPDKNTSYFRYAITVSPTTGSISKEELEVLSNKFLFKQMKNIDKYAYTMEMGTSDSHPHVHMLISFKKDKRRDVLRASCYRYFCKGIPHLKTPKLIYISAARNPSYYLQEYMKKEGGTFVNVGYDVNKLLLEAKALSEKRKIYKLGSLCKPVTRASFPYIYRSFLEDDILKPIGSRVEEQEFSDPIRILCTNEDIRDLYVALVENNFQYHFCVWNVRQVKIIMEFESGLIPLALKDDQPKI